MKVWFVLVLFKFNHFIIILQVPSFTVKVHGTFSSWRCNKIAPQGGSITLSLTLNCWKLSKRLDWVWCWKSTTKFPNRIMVMLGNVVKADIICDLYSWTCVSLIFTELQILIAVCLFRLSLALLYFNAWTKSVTRLGFEYVENGTSQTDSY